MSRHLPDQPNLDHLRKQAKALLRSLQEQNPTAQLADAQHVVAREYGFASWPKLKIHVESLRPVDAGSSETESPFVGTWTADVSKSKRHPANPFRSATLQFAISGDTVTITDVMVDESGRENQGRNTLQADGYEHPAEAGHGYAVTSRWRGSNVLEAVVTKDGQPAGRVTYEVSADGKSLTLSTDEQVAVFERE